ncbi:MAG: ABC transporter permease [Candidatus Competibacteraceae bacterium]|nr:ABC transporter permease [Candidatus Competibacteraceae bacterium]
MPPLLWQLLFFVAPLVFLVVLSFWSVKNFRLVPDFSFANWATMWGRASFWQVYLTTALLASVATVCATVMAFPVSYFISLVLGNNARRLCVLLLIIPFFTSYLVRIYSWQAMLADAGPVNAGLGLLGISPVRFVGTPLGILIGYLTLALPLVILLQVSSMANMDRSLIGAAQNLGCRPLRTVFRVVVPASKVGIALGALFCFILSFGDFVSPLYLGASNPNTLSILITDTAKSGQQWPRAAVIAVTMIVTLLAVAFAMVKLAYRRAGRSA